MKQRAVIFDMDGTIVDTEMIWHEATHRLIKNKNIQLSTEEHLFLQERLHGLATPEACTIIKEVGKLSDPVELLITEKRALAHALYQNGIQFVKGFPEFHAKIKSANIPSGVATNADEKTLSTTNQLINLTQFFGDHLYSIAQVNNRCKPHPDIYLHVAEKLQVHPRDCVAFEDSAHGVAAAKSAGMRCIGINTSKDIHQLRDADIIIDDYHNLDLDALWKYV